jgi:GT2 family glycosyltransferase
MPPSVTAVIVTYNRADLLCLAVDSVLNQTYADCRALIIDDGSTDHTAGLISDRYSGHPRVQYVYQTNRGVSGARNRGIELARGDYLAFLDSDDIWKPWKIEVQMACAERISGVGMVWTNMDAVDAGGRLVKADYLVDHYGAYAHFPGFSMFERSAALSEAAPSVGGLAAGARVYWGDVFSAMLMGNLCLPSTLLVRRDVALKAGSVDEALRTGEDHDYHWRLSRVAGAAFVDVASTLYRVGASDQLTHPSQNLVIAQNTLRTVTRTLERDRPRIALPNVMIRRKLAAVHEWIGREQLDRGDHREARFHFARSLRYLPSQPGTLLRLAAACASPAVTASVRGAYRRLKAHPRLH